MKLPCLILLCAVLATLAGCARSGPTTAPVASLPPVRVRVATVQLESVPELLALTGTVHPARHALIAAKVMGTITELPCVLGQTVRAGDLLVRLSAGEISARLAQAQAQLDQANRDYTRERDLLPKNASTPGAVKNLETRVTLSEAAVREAQVMLGYATVLAPFDGVISRKLVDVGDLASPGAPLVEIEASGAFQVEAGIPDSLAAGLKTGTVVSIAIPAAGVTVEAPLAELSSAADPITHTVAAKFTVPAGVTVRSGEFARLQLPGGTVRGLFAPAGAVVPLGQMERVFVASADGRAVLRLVRTGAGRGDRIEILSGLDDGERVVVAPPADLAEGRMLEVLP